MMNFFNHLDLEKLSIQVGLGKAVYKMSRGTFKTKDHIKSIMTLSWTQTQDDVYTYQNITGDIKLNIHVEKQSHQWTLRFITDANINRVWFALPAFNDEYIYGCGEQFAHFNLKGKKVDIWVSEHHSLKKLLKKFLREKLLGVNPEHISPFKHQQTYYAQPSFLSSKKYFVHVDCPMFQTFSFKDHQTTLAIRGIPTSITILSANQFLDLSTLVSNLLGKHPKLPQWTEQGAIIASQGGIKSIHDKLKTIKDFNMPVVGIWSQDWSGQLITSFGHQVYWNWQVDETLYPNLKEEIKQLRSKDIRFLGYINTFLKEDTPLYLEALKHGYLVLNQKKEVYKIKSTTFEAGIIDLSHPKAYTWYQSVIKKEMIDLGMSGWMADFGEYLPTDAIIYAKDAEAYHNLWPAIWAKLNYEVIRDANKLEEIFFFTRAGYTQSIPYTHTMWAGDQHVDFSKEYGLPSAIIASLSLACSGVGLNHSDIGGYTTILHMKRDKELWMRWAEMNVFSPLFRAHEGNKPYNNVQFDHDDEVATHFSKMAHVFKQLEPYLKDMKEIYYNQGIPVIRPLFFHFDDPQLFDISYQYMYGSCLLVCPVIKKGSVSQNIYLPEGKWIKLFTHETLNQGTHNIKTPIGIPIAFYQEDHPYESLFKSLTL